MTQCIAEATEFLFKGIIQMPVLVLVPKTLRDNSLSLKHYGGFSRVRYLLSLLPVTVKKRVAV